MAPRQAFPWRYFSGLTHNLCLVVVVCLGPKAWLNLVQSHPWTMYLVSKIDTYGVPCDHWLHHVSTWCREYALTATGWPTSDCLVSSCPDCWLSCCVTTISLILGLSESSQVLRICPITEDAGVWFVITCALFRKPTGIWKVSLPCHLSFSSNYILPDILPDIQTLCVQKHMRESVLDKLLWPHLDGQWLKLSNVIQIHCIQLSSCILINFHITSKWQQWQSIRIVMLYSTYAINCMYNTVFFDLRQTVYLSVAHYRIIGHRSVKIVNFRQYTYWWNFFTYPY